MAVTTPATCGAMSMPCNGAERADRRQPRAPALGFHCLGRHAVGLRREGGGDKPLTIAGLTQTGNSRDPPESAAENSQRKNEYNQSTDAERKPRDQEQQPQYRAPSNEDDRGNGSVNERKLRRCPERQQREREQGQEPVRQAPHRSIPSSGRVFQPGAFAPRLLRRRQRSHRRREADAELPADDPVGTSSSGAGAARSSRTVIPSLVRLNRWWMGRSPIASQSARASGTQRCRTTRRRTPTKWAPRRSSGVAPPPRVSKPPSATSKFRHPGRARLPCRSNRDRSARRPPVRVAKGGSRSGRASSPAERLGRIRPARR